MGQKFAAYDVQGNITGFYDAVDSPPPEDIRVVAISESEWQNCLGSTGYTVVNGVLTAPTAAQLLAQAKDVQVSAINASCMLVLMSGFDSSALGSARTYPSQTTDQRNLMSAALASMGQGSSWSTALWCTSGDSWSFSSHTATQVQQVNADWVSFRTAAQQKCADLIQKIQAAKTIAAVQAVSW